MIKGNESVMPLIASELGCDGDHGDYRYYSNVYSEGGLTLRQHFAGLAMQGFITSGCNWHKDHYHVANVAMRFADALIEELNKQE